MNDVSENYLHGYHEEEQRRLFTQGMNLEKYIYPFIDFRNRIRILEVGCGVGAQTRILLERFPNLQITALDYADAQINVAKKSFEHHPREGQVVWKVDDASALREETATFDGAFVCWVLEHASSPKKIVGEIHRTLKHGGVAYFTEVLNASLFTSPHSQPIIDYWSAYNQHQLSIGGDPYLGARLPDLLLNAGFSDVTTNTITYHIDQRFNAGQRKQAYDYWKSLFLSAAPQLLGAERILPKLVEQMENDFDGLRERSDSIFFLVAMQAKAIK